MSTSNTTTLRYSQPRLLLRWDRNPHLKILKMLGWIIFDKETIHNAERLEARVAELFPTVVEVITGEPGVTYKFVQEQTLAEQGAPITAGKLLQRADRTDRYLEINEYCKQVEAAYAARR